MPKRIPVNTVIVHRDGKNIAPPVGKIFNFTQEELDDINKVMPGAVRKPINEDVDTIEEYKVEPDAKADAKSNTTAKADAKPAAKTATKAAESKKDEEL